MVAMCPPRRGRCTSAPAATTRRCPTTPTPTAPAGAATASISISAGDIYLGWRPDAFGRGRPELRTAFERLSPGQKAYLRAEKDHEVAPWPSPPAPKRRERRREAARTSSPR